MKKEYDCNCCVCGKEFFSDNKFDVDSWCSDKCEEEDYLIIDSRETLPQE